MSVIVLEEGAYFDASTYSRDPFEALPRLYRDAGLTVAEGRPAIPLPVGRCVGGTTVINSGTCFRAPAEVMKGWRESFGIDWAVELDPRFEAAEEMLRVAAVDPARMGRNGQLAMEGAAAIGASGGPISRNAGSCVQCSSCPLG
jgi:choline dehydrogenase-like flavoprotein